MKSIITSILFIVVGSLVVATSGFSHQDSFSHKNQVHMSQTRNFLKLSPQQQEVLGQKRLEIHKKLIPIFAELKVAQLELSQLEWANEPQMEGITQKVEQISKIRQQIEMAHISFRSEFRSLLTPEQRQQWKQQQSLIGSGMMHSMMGNQGMMDMMHSMGSQGMMGGQGMMDMMYSMMGGLGTMYSMMGGPGMVDQDITPDNKSSLRANPEMMHEEEMMNQKK